MICISVFRLIPAHAGKTRTRPSTRRTPTAHPRSRGENQAITQPLVFVGGSSPLTRGKPVATAPSRLPIRLIPAHAGKTSHASSHAGWGWAHPRSRGENNQFSLPSPVSDGSSPLTRGKPIAALVAIFVARLIPAHAGKTASWRAFRRPCPAHPRSRGENRFSPPLWPDVSGSSPLTRGKPLGRRGRRNPLRLIPAHAGKTPTDHGGGLPFWAHPRSRGENPPTDLNCLPFLGHRN